MSALISECGVYRYTLSRHVGPQATEIHGKAKCGQVLWVMLNPSTADARIDDPTIKRCRSFTAATAYDRMTVVNLFAYRATQPSQLLDAEDPIGPDNDKHITSCALRSNMVIVAWGGSIPKGYEGRVDEVVRLLAKAGHTDLYCLSKTKKGAPGHPLYLPQSVRPLLWSISDCN